MVQEPPGNDNDCFREISKHAYMDITFNYLMDMNFWR